MFNSRGDKKIFALALGDPNGIGPEIAIKAALAYLDEPPLLVGDVYVARHFLEMLSPKTPLSILAGDEPLRRGTVNIHPVEFLREKDFAPGQISAAAGRATVEYVKSAVSLAQAGRVDAIIACPHNETAVNAAGIVFSGYPELIAETLEIPEGRVFLMLVGGGLRIVHVTLHEQLLLALKRLTSDLVVSAGMAAVEALKSLGFDRPRIGLFGINPHASEGGLFGDDDARITLPASEALRQAGVHLEGPFGADILLGSEGFDAFVAMYHDQGHIPVKLKAGRFSSALTIGAGILFSTVGHGSAHDIAGRGVADPEGILRTLTLLRGVG